MRKAALLTIVLTSAALMLACSRGEASGAEPQDGTRQAAPRRVRVTVAENGYTPGTIQAEAGKPITIVFKRVTDAGCGQEVVFPDHSIRRALPLNQDVEVTLTPRAAETIRFTCGMNMLRGSIVAISG